MPVAEMVDREKHPPRRMIPTRGDRESASIHWTTVLALVLLGVFVVALPLAGFLGVIDGRPAGAGFLGLALSALTAAYLLGSE